MKKDSDEYKTDGRGRVKTSRGATLLIYALLAVLFLVLWR